MVIKNGMLVTGTWGGSIVWRRLKPPEESQYVDDRDVVGVFHENDIGVIICNTRVKPPKGKWARPRYCEYVLVLMNGELGYVNTHSIERVK